MRIAKPVTLGRQLQLARQDKRLLQHVVAGRVGITQNFLSLCENDKRLPGTKLLQKLANLYGTTFTIAAGNGHGAA